MWTLKRIKKPVSWLIGVDLGAHSIKALALAGEPTNYQVAAQASVVTPQGCLVDHQVQDVHALVLALKQLRRQFNRRGQKVATAITGSGVSTKVITLPAHVPAELFEQHVLLEAEQHLSFPLDEISLDYQLLTSSASTTEQRRVLVSAARTEAINLRVKALQMAGWQTKIMDVGAHALARAVIASLEESPALDSLLALADIGAHSLTFIVLESRELTYHRVQHLDAPLPTTQAEADARVALIQQHIQRNLQLFCSSTAQATPAILWLCGGGSLLPNLAERLTQTLGIQVAHPDFTSLVGLPATQQAELLPYGCALGLALRSLMPCPK